MSEPLHGDERPVLLAGQPFPLGATLQPEGINFAVFSAHARRIDLCLFDARGERELFRLQLPMSTHQVWHGFLPRAKPGLVYGYRAFGPYQPRAGQRFNAHKLLLDPYARSLVGPTDSVDAMRGALADSPSAGTTRRDRRNSAPVSPKAVVIDEPFDWGDTPRPNTPLANSVLYEVHVRGVSMLRDDLAPNLRGTFAALADARFIAHLQELGVTAIELLPIHAVLHDRFLVHAGRRNYWGYNSLAYFAPNPAYLSGPSLNEIRQAIQTLHRAGIEVLLDVVYNHSAESDQHGPTVSFRGLDNANYYLLAKDSADQYVNDTGCGNTLNTAHPRVLQMVLDSLRYWVEEFHVDGFRFDLAPTLGREDGRFDPRSGLLRALMQDPVLGRVKLIAEPWDLGPGGYCLGQFPAGFAEWNDRFRDCVRRFWRGDAGQRGELAARLSASPDFFEHDGRQTDASVNFVTAHDGFTLTDLVSYATKHNDANGENNRDGTDDNHSSAWGAQEGPGDATQEALRERVKRAMLVTLFCAHGVPMLLAGDEFGRTQGGNNNAYCQDSPLSWIDWSLLDSQSGRCLTQFVARLGALRRELAPLRSARFLHGASLLGQERDTDWFDEHGEIVTAARWNDASIRTLALRRVSVHQAQRLEVLVLLNAGTEVAQFVLPGVPSSRWRLRLLSHAPDGGVEQEIEATLELFAHSAAILSRITDAH